MIARPPTEADVNLLKRYIPAAIVCVTITVAVALVVTLASGKQYRAQMTLAVGTTDDVISAELGNETQAVVNTVSQLLRSHVVAEKVVDRLKLEQSPQEFIDSLDVKQKPDAAALDVSYDGPSRRAATAALRQLVSVYEEQVRLVGADVSQPVRDSAGGEAARTLKIRARVFDPPHAGESPVSPRPLRNLAVAVILGLVAAGFWLALRDALEIRGRERAAEAATRGSI